MGRVVGRQRRGHGKPLRRLNAGMSVEDETFITIAEFVVTVKRTAQRPHTKNLQLVYSNMTCQVPSR